MSASEEFWSRAIQMFALLLLLLLSHQSVDKTQVCSAHSQDFRLQDKAQQVATLVEQTDFTLH